VTAFPTLADVPDDKGDDFGHTDVQLTLDPWSGLT